MAVNTVGLVHRTALDELEDLKQTWDNYRTEEWKHWPNEGAFDGLEEHRGPIKLKVIGRIPPWAAGTLYRIGPGRSQLENTARGTHYVSHWFDGLAHAHKFDIFPSGNEESKCSVIYSSRQQSAEFCENVREKGWRADISFGQKSDPCIGIFAKFMTVFAPRKSNNNVTIIPNFPGLSGRPASSEGENGHGINSLVTSTDNAMLERIDPKTLEPVGKASQADLHPDLKGVFSCAHAQRDPETGDVFNFNMDLGRFPTYRIFRVNARSGTTDILATITDKELAPAYIHSFFLTQNHVVLCIPGSHFGWKGLKILWERNLIESIKPFDKREKCWWLVVDRRHGRGLVARFSTPADFFFHSVNAFEESAKDESGHEVTNIYLDSIRYENTDVMHLCYYDVLMNRNETGSRFLSEGEKYKSSHGYLVRYKFSLYAFAQDPSDPFHNTAEQDFSIPSPHAGELPVINPLRTGKAYRYVYGVSTRGKAILLDSLVKTDLETRNAIMWNGPAGHTPGEPIFVPRPGGTDEDDGVILSLVLDGSAQTSYLLCLDAKSFAELGRAETDFPIALSLHGSHVASAN